MPPYLLYWGKAHDEQVPRWHPLAYHSLDVAAATMEYLRANPQILKRLARLAGLSKAEVLAWMVFLAGAHDVGKFGLGFQSKLSHLCPAVLGETGVAEFYDHQVTGVSILVEWLGARLDTPMNVRTEGNLERLANVACAHHGSPVTHKTGLWTAYPGAKAAAYAYLADLWDLAGMSQVMLKWPEKNRQQIRQFSWLASGVITLADWVGSARQQFPYQMPGLGVVPYFEQARARACAALAQNQLTEPAPALRGGFAELYARAESATPMTPSPLQAYADTVPLSDKGEPQLFILEDETGAGKTEAALTLASRLMAAGHARGMFFCLPTQTTANAVFQRVAPLAAHLFAEGANPSLCLAHGQARQALHALLQNEQFVGSISAELQSWAQERSKTALLADLGVGTIDQVVLAGLSARHVSLRILGMAQKVLVVDEVHACDAYQLRVLAAVLEQHARLGGSAIVLSATLPRTMKRALAKAFARGLGSAQEPKLGADAYPLATEVSEQGCVETGIESRRLPRRVEFQPIEEADIAPLVDRWLAEGKCVCILRNTVALAQATFEQFSARYGERSRVVHARYMMADRADNDQRLLADFGKDSGESSRKGQLIIATQVVEASLDVDFDELITDLAPIDSLLQRMGRWRRHSRDAHGERSPEESRAPSKAYIVAPNPRGSGFLRKLAQGTVFVYPEVDVLWRTASIVHEWGALEVPTQVRQAVEFAYQEGGEPDWVVNAAMASQGENLAAAQLAYSSVLKWDDGYHPQSGGFSGEQTVTRLGDASAQVVLCDEAGNPLAGTGPFAESASMLSVRYEKVGGGEEVDGKFWIRLKWSAESECWLGAAQGTSGREYTVRYSRCRGLSFQ